MDKANLPAQGKQTGRSNEVAPPVEIFFFFFRLSCGIGIGKALQLSRSRHLGPGQTSLHGTISALEPARNQHQVDPPG